MLTASSAVQAVVHQHIRAVLAESGTEVGIVRGHQTLYELGVTSLHLAQLIIQLRADLGVDPYAEDESAFDARTVAAVVALYEQALARRTPVAGGA